MKKALTTAIRSIRPFRMLDNMKLMNKLLVLMMISTFFMMILGLISYFYMKNANDQLHKIYEERLLPVSWLQSILADSRTNEVHMMEIMMAVNNPLRQARHMEEINNNDLHMDQFIRKIEQSMTDGDSVHKLQRLKAQLNLYRTQRQETIDIAVNGKMSEAYANKLTTDGSLEALNATLTELVDHQIALADAMKEENMQHARQAMFTLITTIALSIVLSHVLGWILAKRFTAPIARMMLISQQIAKGNMQVRVPEATSQDEVGQLTNSFHLMVEHLRYLIQHVKSSVDEVAHSSDRLLSVADQTTSAGHRISSTIQQLAASAQLQIEDANVSVEALNQMQSGLQHISETLETVHTSAEHMSNEARDGQEVIINSKNQIENIREAARDSLSNMENLIDSTKKISHVAQFMSHIANETNLLALNASIEAARAGEHGRSFSVVAIEIRKLAEQTVHYVKEIEEMNRTIMSSLGSSSRSIEQVVHEVNAGIEVMKYTGDKFRQIVSSARRTADEVNSLSTAWDQIAHYSSDVMQKIRGSYSIAQEMASSTQEVAATTMDQLGIIEQIHDSAHKLKYTADGLEQSVKEFQL